MNNQKLEVTYASYYSTEDKNMQEKIVEYVKEALKNTTYDIKLFIGIEPTSDMTHVNMKIESEIKVGGCPSISIAKKIVEWYPKEFDILYFVFDHLYKNIKCKEVKNNE